MKAMILAAGRGERMLALTANFPKPLLMVKGKALIEHHIINLVQAGITEIVINLWYHGQKISNFLGDGSNYGAKLIYVEETKLLNTGGGIQNALRLFVGEDFIVISADIFCDFNFASLKLAADKLAHIILVSNPEYNLVGDFALQHDLISMPAIKPYTYANIGIYSTNFFNQEISPYSLGWLLKDHAAKQLVTGAIYNGLWFNVGTPLELQRANCYHLV
jgi:MurNAc alpha-1-phosphate uridylyltransferase